MKSKFKNLIATTGLLASLGLVGMSHAAETHQVSAAGVKFNPLITFIESGDSVSFTNMVGHLVETVDSMVPEGQERIASELSADVFATFEIEGIVVYKCTPHWGNRMGGIIVVGKPEDPAAIIDGYLAALKLEENAVDKPARGLLKKLQRQLIAKGWMEAPPEA